MTRFSFSFTCFTLPSTKRIGFQGVSIGGRVREEHIPEPPSTEYFIGFSCLGSKTSTQIGSNSCGIYIKTLLGVFKDGFWRPSTEYGKS